MEDFFSLAQQSEFNTVTGIKIGVTGCYYSQIHINSAPYLICREAHTGGL